jgi:hypothetical protein
MVRDGSFENADLDPWEFSGGATVSLDKETYYDGSQGL